MGIYSALIAQVGQSLAIFESVHQGLLLFAAFPFALVSDQGIGHFRKRGLNGLLILCQACSRSARANWTLDLIRPAVNMGCVTCGTRLQARADR